MDKNLSIVKVDKRPYRVIAQENWGLTDAQMKGRHVHHRIKKSEGGTNDPSNLYVCTEEYHDKVWHADEGGFAGLASKGGKTQPPEGKVKGGTSSHKMGVGIHARTDPRNVEGNRKGGKNQPREAKIKGGREGGLKGSKITNSQKYQNTDPNWPLYISTAAGLARWQRVRGIDTAQKVRVF
jgi:hypothetical protein